MGAPIYRRVAGLGLVYASSHTPRPLLDCPGLYGPDHIVGGRKCLPYLKTPSFQSTDRENLKVTMLRRGRTEKIL